MLNFSFIKNYFTFQWKNSSQICLKGIDRIRFLFWENIYLQLSKTNHLPYTIDQPSIRENAYLTCFKYTAWRITVSIESVHGVYTLSLYFSKYVVTVTSGTIWVYVTGICRRFSCFTCFFFKLTNLFFPFFFSINTHYFKCLVLKRK